MYTHNEIALEILNKIVTKRLKAGEARKLIETARRKLVAFETLNGYEVKIAMFYPSVIARTVELAKEEIAELSSRGITRPIAGERYLTEIKGVSRAIKLTKHAFDIYGRLSRQKAAAAAKRLGSNSFKNATPVIYADIPMGSMITRININGATWTFINTPYHETYVGV